jgi:hypothetical protein
LNEPVRKVLVGTAHPTSLDSRLRGNDMIGTAGVQRGKAPLPRVWGCSRFEVPGIPLWQSGMGSRMVQQNAAGVWGVPKISSSSPKSGGQGVEKSLGTELV